MVVMTWELVGAAGIQRVETRVDAEHHTVPRTAPTRKNHPAPNVSSGEDAVEKPHFRRISVVLMSQV